MPRPSNASISAFGFFALGILAPAQLAASPQAPSDQAGSVAQLTFGTSLSPLNGPWKFQIGDSPLDPIAHAPMWAEPGFDDSK